MRNKFYSKVSLLLFVVLSFFVNAQVMEGVEPPAPGTQSGDIGGMFPTSPIDHYIILLLINAILLAVYTIKSKKSVNISK